jgi:hypothetical protein
MATVLDTPAALLCPRGGCSRWSPVTAGTLCWTKPSLPLSWLLRWSPRRPCAGRSQARPRAGCSIGPRGGLVLDDGEPALELAAPIGPGGDLVLDEAEPALELVAPWSLQKPCAGRSQACCLT